MWFWIVLICDSALFPPVSNAKGFSILEDFFPAGRTNRAPTTCETTFPPGPPALPGLVRSSAVQHQSQHSKIFLPEGLTKSRTPRAPAGGSKHLHPGDTRSNKLG